MGVGRKLAFTMRLSRKTRIIAGVLIAALLFSTVSLIYTSHVPIKTGLNESPGIAYAANSVLANNNDYVGITQLSG